MIPVWHPYLGEEEKKALIDVIDIGYLGMGKSVFEFEEAVSNEIGCDKTSVVATHTGQSALHSILEGLSKYKQITHVITPSMNNIADFQAILGINAQPIFCDCDPKTGLIDLESINKDQRDRAQALIVLDYASNKVCLEKAKQFSEENNLYLIYDAAHSFGSVGKNRLDYADATMFSFDPIKTFTAIDAGIAYSKDKNLIDNIRHIRHMGMEQDLEKLQKNGRSFDYDVKNRGYRYHLSNTHAAVGIRQINKKEEISKKRHRIIKSTREMLRNSKVIENWIPYDKNMIPFMNVALIKKGYRNELREFLESKQIQTGIHWKPGHMFTKFSTEDDRLSQTNIFYEKILSLPLFTGMEDFQIELLSRAVYDFEELI